MDLSTYSLADLRQLSQSVAAEIESRSAQEIAKAKEEILAIAKSVGVPLEELLGPTSKVGRVKAASNGQADTPKQKKPAKYENPEDPTQTWSGAGRSPFWVKRHLDAGGLLEALRIKEPK